MLDEKQFHHDVLDNEAKREVLLAEIKILSNAIIAADGQSNQIKQWCLTLCTACWDIFFAKHVIPGLSDLNAMITFGIVVVPLVFAIQDIMTKRNQRKLLWRTRVIHSQLNFDPALSTITSGFHLYDVAGHGQAQKEPTFFYPKEEEYEKYISPLASLIGSTSVKCFYSVLIFICLLFSVLINFLM